MKQIQSQNKKLLAHLKKGKRITGLQAFKTIGTLCLPRRIKDLTDDGYLIDSIYVPVKNRDGKKVLVKRYWLVNPFQQIK